MFTESFALIIIDICINSIECSACARMSVTGADGRLDSINKY